MSERRCFGVVVAGVVMALGVASCARSASGADDAQSMTVPTVDAGDVSVTLRQKARGGITVTATS